MIMALKGERQRFLTPSLFSWGSPHVEGSKNPDENWFDQAIGLHWLPALGNSYKANLWGRALHPLLGPLNTVRYGYAPTNQRLCIRKLPAVQSFPGDARMRCKWISLNMSLNGTPIFIAFHLIFILQIVANSFKCKQNSTNVNVLLAIIGLALTCLNNEG